MRIQLAIYSINDDLMLADWSNRVDSCNVRTNQHGYESCEAEIRIPFQEAFIYYQQLGPLKLRVSWGASRIWEGRIEDPTQFAATPSGLKITALGYWSAYNDIPYTAFWSDTSYDDWQVVTEDERTNRRPKMYAFDTSDRLYISLQKNTTYTTAADVASLRRYLPDQGSRQIVGVSFDYDITLPANWVVSFSTANIGYLLANTFFSLTAGGVRQQGSINLDLSANPRDFIFLQVFNNTGANYNNTAENGAWYCKINNLRFVTSVANWINTTLGTTIAAGTRTVNPGNMARIYVGQRLFINQSGAGAESVIVTAVTSTSFTAVFANAHNNTDTVRAHVVYPDEIIKDCLTVSRAVNSSQYSSDTSLIQSQAIDLDQAIYEDQYPADIINGLLDKADTSARQWLAMVYDDQRLIVRPRGSGNTWYVDAATLEINRTLAELANSVYAIYRDTNDRKLRTAVASDATSLATYGITKRVFTEVESTISAQATAIRDTTLVARKDPIPRTKIDIRQVFDQFGASWPLFFIRADDILVLRNLPPTLSTTLDAIRVLNITRTDYDLTANVLSLDLEIPQPRLDILIAQALKG